MGAHSPRRREHAHPLLGADTGSAHDPEKDTKTLKPQDSHCLTAHGSQTTRTSANNNQCGSVLSLHKRAAPDLGHGQLMPPPPGGLPGSATQPCSGTGGAEGQDDSLKRVSRWVTQATKPSKLMRSLPSAYRRARVCCTWVLSVKPVAGDLGHGGAQGSGLTWPGSSTGCGPSGHPHCNPRGLACALVLDEALGSSTSFAAIPFRVFQMSTSCPETESHLPSRGPSSSLGRRWSLSGCDQFPGRCPRAAQRFQVENSLQRPHQSNSLCPLLPREEETSLTPPRRFPEQREEGAEGQGSP